MERLHASIEARSASAVPGSVAATLRRPGKPLDGASKALLERGFGRDFSGVRVHADELAASSATEIGAAAYACGSSIAFGAGRYQPNTPAGRRLLAHELSHVAQQGVPGRTEPLALDRPGTPRSALDTVADRAATRIGLGIPVTRSPDRAPAGLVQRSPLSDAVVHDLGGQPSTAALLARLGAADVQATTSDPDLDAEIGRLLGRRTDDIWLAQRIWHGLRPKAAGASAPKPIEAHFFTGATDRRALVIAGVHGSERQGMAVARMLIDLLKTRQPALTTIVVPSLFPDNAAQGEFGKREGATLTNRNFPTPDKDLAATQAAGSVDANGKQVLPENLLLLELIERFHPERIISIHGTWDPNLAGVSYDPRALNADEQQRAASARVSGRTNYSADGEEQANAELRTGLRANQLKSANEADRRKSLAAAAQIDSATKGLPGRDARVALDKLKPHASVAGNYDSAGELTKARWGGDSPKGVSLGGYAPARGISVFTVEPAIDRNVEDYRDKPGKVADKVSAADRKIELQAYAEAVHTVLLGR